MATSIFDEKEYQPTDNDLEQALKSSIAVWDLLFDYLRYHYGNLETEWKFYSKKAGWTLRITDSTGKNILFLSPNDNHFLVTVNMSEAVKEKVLQADISEENKAILKNAKVCITAPLLTTIKDKKDLEDIKTVLSIRDNYIKEK